MINSHDNGKIFSKINPVIIGVVDEDSGLSLKLFIQ
jgi:hypothetical protein